MSKHDDVKMDSPQCLTKLMNRIESAKEGHEIAVFVKANGEVFSVFSDTVAAKELMNMPPFNSKFVGKFHSEDGQGLVNHRIHQVHKRFKFKF